jgi:hypothetical protein
MYRENSLFFLSADGPTWLAKRSELCGMRCGAMPEQEPKPQYFPVKFPVSREMQREKSLLETARTTNSAIHSDRLAFSTCPKIKSC